MKKVLVILVGIFAFTLSIGFVGAEKIAYEVGIAKPNNFKPIPSEEGIYSIVLDENNMMFFESEEDLESYKVGMDIGVRAGTDGYMTVPTKVSSTRNTNTWVGYHSYTPDWYYASSYTLGKGKTFSASGSYKYSNITVSLSYSNTTAVTVTIPADPKKASRLGVWGDYTFTKYKYTEHRYGKPTGKAPTYSVVATKHSHTIKPKYK